MTVDIYQIADKAKVLSQLHSWLCEVDQGDSDVAKAIERDFEDLVDVIDEAMCKPTVRRYVENIGLNW